MSIIAVAAMMLVSCKKDNGDDNKGKDDNKTVDEYTGPVEGTSAWSVVGTLLESDWGGGAHGDYVMAEASEGVFVLKNVKLIATDAFKFRENKKWDNAYKGVFVTLGEAFDVDNTPGEVNIEPALEGIYDLYFNVTVEQAAIVAKDGAEPTWEEVVPEPITVDGDMSDWAEIAAFASSQNSRIREWKFKASEKYVYFYFSLRKNRVDSARTLYIGFDTDNNSETGASHGNIAGCEAVIKAVPFTNVGEATTPVPVDGFDNQSKADANEGAVYCKVYDAGEDLGSSSSSIYLEISVSRDKLALPASGQITVGCSYDWYVTGVQAVTL